jgi:hypothetical protein
MKSFGMAVRTGYQPLPRFRPVRVLRSGETATRRGGVAIQDEVFELLMIEEADAWFEYLEATRGQGESRYAEIEPWAWSRLRQRLRALKARRARLERPAA